MKDYQGAIALVTEIAAIVVAIPPVLAESPQVTALQHQPRNGFISIAVSGSSAVTAPDRTIAQATTSETPLPQPLVPDPEITIDGKPAPQIRPTSPSVPMLPRAVAPPVGDVAASEIDTSPGRIDLGSDRQIPRLVVRQAPVREVLSILGRAADLNVVYLDNLGGNSLSPNQANNNTEDPKISLDIQNESVQSLFNFVLQASGLEANRVGRTIFVGAKLPNSTRNVVMRGLRLNQVPVTTAINFLVGLGAESAISRERLVTSVNAVPVATAATGSTSSTAITQSQTTTETKVESQRLQLQDSVPILRGLQVLGDERTNSITLVGNPRLVEIAIAQLIQLDIRRRQVAVNVRVIDINLASYNRMGSSFSFGVGDSSFINQAGIAILNFGSSAPSGTSTTLTNDLSSAATNIGSQTLGSVAGSAFNVARNFLLQLQASVREGNAKILTDPTIIVQEGQTATLNLTQEVITNFNVQTVASTGSTQSTVTVEKAKAGLILPIQVSRIDDNGFISLSVAPSISRPTSSASVNVGGNTNTITLLAERSLQSGQIRLRDGQTLILSGIIQDTDRTSVAKVPILGDLPLLGALFRRTEKERERQEVIVLLTPRVLTDSEYATNSSYFYLRGTN